MIQTASIVENGGLNSFIGTGLLFSDTEIDLLWQNLASSGKNVIDAIPGTNIVIEPQKRRDYMNFQLGMTTLEDGAKSWGPVEIFGVAKVKQSVNTKEIKPETTTDFSFIAAPAILSVLPKIYRRKEVQVSLAVITVSWIILTACTNGEPVPSAAVVRTVTGIPTKVLTETPEPTFTPISSFIPSPTKELAVTDSRWDKLSESEKLINPGVQISEIKGDFSIQAVLDTQNGLGGGFKTVSGDGKELSITINRPKPAPFTKPQQELLVQFKDGSKASVELFRGTSLFSQLDGNDVVEFKFRYGTDQITVVINGHEVKTLSVANFLKSGKLSSIPLVGQDGKNVVSELSVEVPNGGQKNVTLSEVVPATSAVVVTPRPQFTSVPPATVKPNNPPTPTEAFDMYGDKIITFEFDSRAGNWWTGSVDTKVDVLFSANGRIPDYDAAVEYAQKVAYAGKPNVRVYWIDPKLGIWKSEKFTSISPAQDLVDKTIKESPNLKYQIQYVRERSNKNLNSMSFDITAPKP